MKKSGSDPKVTKTLVRNSEQKIRKEQARVIHDVDASSKSSLAKENELDHPSLCSSEVLAKYLVDTKRSLSSPQADDLNVDKGEMTAKVTKRLNFQFNDRIYKNLIELNADTANLKNKRDKKPSRPNSVKKDLEPKIEDFYDNDEDTDICPSIPVIRPKFKPIRHIDNSHLHRLVSSFECL